VEIRLGDLEATIMPEQNTGHCEGRRPAAIQGLMKPLWIASLRSQ